MAMILEKGCEIIETFLRKAGMPSDVHLLSDSNIGIAIITHNHGKKIDDFVTFSFDCESGPEPVLKKIWVWFPKYMNDPIEISLHTMAAIIASHQLDDYLGLQARDARTTFTAVLPKNEHYAKINYQGRFNLRVIARNIPEKSFTITKPFLYHWKYILMVILGEPSVFGNISSRYFTANKRSANGECNKYVGYVHGHKYTYDGQFHMATVRDLYVKDALINGMKCFTPFGFSSPKSIPVFGGYRYSKDEGLNYVFCNSVTHDKELQISLESGVPVKCDDGFELTVLKRTDMEGDYLVVQRSYNGLVLEECPLIDFDSGYLMPWASSIEYDSKKGLFIPTGLI